MTQYGYLDFLELRAKVKSWSPVISSGRWTKDMTALDKRDILDNLRAQFEREQMAVSVAQIGNTYGDVW